MEVNRKKRVSSKKATGAHFTPPELASFISKRLLEYARVNSIQGDVTILDPSCGDGELLMAVAGNLEDKALGRVTLVGVETDEGYLEQTRRRLGVTSVETSLVKKDFLEMSLDYMEPSMFNTEGIGAKFPVNVIIANPPYVRTQVLGADAAQKLAKTFNLTGRVDLYQAFLVAMTNILAPGGFIGVITSNRYLTTKGATSLRKFLQSNYDILEIIDLGDTKFFEAAVLPALFFGRKKEASSRASVSTKFVKLYECDAETNSKVSAINLISVLEDPKDATYQIGEKCYKVTCGDLTISDDPAVPWVMATSKEKEWLDQVINNSHCLIEDCLKVRVGIKTTADNVFIRDDWNNLPRELVPEETLLKPLFTSDFAEKWLPTEGPLNLKVLYPHEVVDGRRKAIDISQYSGGYNYLVSHKEQLNGRKYIHDAKRNWYEIWVPQNPDAWSFPKIVFPDISLEPKFFYDNKGCIVNGNCYWITTPEGTINDIFLLALAVCNSRFMTVYHDLAFQNKLYSGRRRYLTQYVSKYPLPNPETPASHEIVNIVKRLISDPLKECDREQMEERIENLLSTAFQVKMLDI